MIQLRTMVKIADNSGGRVLQCIHVLGGSVRRYGRLGDIIVGTVKVADPRKEVKKHDVVRALIIRQRKEYKRSDGTHIRFDDNACVILEGKTKKPKGGRIFGPVAREIKEKGFQEVVGIAQQLV
ncbi:MAG: 50S ribosomal protein L14 [Patescibacteria group bacterium]|nr:50S ribosomal protein L14 [Patescibacteria group bacterium]